MDGWIMRINERWQSHGLFSIHVVVKVFKENDPLHSNWKLQTDFPCVTFPNFFPFTTSRQWVAVRGTTQLESTRLPLPPPPLQSRLIAWFSSSARSASWTLWPWRRFARWGRRAGWNAMCAYSFSLTLAELKSPCDRWIIFILQFGFGAWHLLVCWFCTWLPKT